MRLQKKKNQLIFILFLFCSISLISYTVAYHHFPGGGGGNTSQKYAIFMWSSDAGRQDVIEDYQSILISKGYLTFLYEDPLLIVDIFIEIDELEDEEDVLFFYFMGHGTYEAEEGISEFYYCPGVSFSSEWILPYFNDFESHSIAVLMESCQAGEFVERFDANDRYLFMTSTDRDHNAKAYGKELFADDPGAKVGEGIFSNYFWKYINKGYSTITAFQKAKNKNAEEPIVCINGACDIWTNQYPQITTYAGEYNFF